MVRHFEHELQDLKSELIKMGSFVEQALANSIEAITTQNRELAGHVITEDVTVNNFEMKIDQAIVDLLALQQPVASDLRLILATSKINNDLERIGDHAVNLAQSATVLITMQTLLPAIEEIKAMANVSRRMLSDALDSFIHIDSKLGEAVLRMDDTADDLNKKIAKEMMLIMKSNAQTVDQAMELIRVSRNLERVADLATNIAEEVVFMAKAKVVKHHSNDTLETR